MHPPTPTTPPHPAHTVALAAAALLAGAAIGAALDAAGTPLVEAPTPRDALPASATTALELLTHNARVALWPLLLVALDWPKRPVTRLIGDALVAGHLIGHGAVIGSALAQQPGLWRYLPHLPLEWLAIALPAATWLAARSAAIGPKHGVLAITAALILVTLALAALTEIYLVPL
jgi:hypothetical protein